jgi:hypothetical protein
VQVGGVLLSKMIICFVCILCSRISCVIFLIVANVAWIVVAKNTEEARDILANLFNCASKDEIETLRYMLIEVCVCVFHGFSSSSPTKEPDAVSLVSKPEEEVAYRESKLGKEPLSVVGVDKADEDFQYDEYSDDSHGDTSYSDSDFGAIQQTVSDEKESEEKVRT